MRTSRLMRWHLALVALTIVATTYLYRTLPLRADSLTDIYILDVGQGDGIFIRTATGENILIDGGPNAGIVSQLASLIPAWDRAIDLVILTHAHADHITGLGAVLDKFPILDVWYSGAAYDSNVYRSLLEKISQKKIPIEEVANGKYVQFGRDSLRVVSPAGTKPTDSDANETSIVAMFTEQDFDLLLTGDMTENNERELVSRGLVPDVDVIKVPHHGSRTSSSDTLLDAARPELAIISAGRGNDYGHPHSETLARYAARGIPVLRTDLLGSIHLVTDGTSYKVIS